MTTQFDVLATDYDGTIATHGVVDDATLAALRRARDAGIQLVLVSGRERESLARVFAHFEIFDLMVLENGATLYEPATQTELPLCDPPRAAFVAALRAADVHPLSVGKVIVATTEPQEVVVRETIRALGLDYQVILNKGAVMVLPPGIDKASGLKEGLARLGVAAERTVAVGDAENDHALLELVGIGAAVSNAVPSLKDRADFVATRDHGAGVAELIEAMLAGNLARASPIAHRPSPMSHLFSRMTIRIGIDLGGTKIEGVALDTAGRIVARERIATPRDYDAALAAIAGLVAGIEHTARDTGGVGIGIPGAVQPNGLVKNANSTWLIGRPLVRDLETVLRRPVRVANDANCFAISEAADGAGANHDVVFGVILGTGVGGGVVVHGHPLDGPNLIAGEWGHNPLPWMSADEAPGRPCYCGKRGCIETFLSGPGFAADHLRATGVDRTSAQIVDDATAGVAGAIATVARYHDRLARSLAVVINILDPHVIVLGGGMSNLPNLAEAVTARLTRYVFSNEVLTRVVKNAHGDSSGVRGAAWLWPDGNP